MTGPAPSRLGLGTHPLGGGYGPVSEDTARAVIDAALAHGWTVVDTAESYASEEVLGRALGTRRDKVFLAGKVFPARPYTARNLRSALEGSLRRLKTDHLDLFQLHGLENAVLDLPRTPVAELAESLIQLVDAGLTARVGVCNYPVGELEELSEHLPLFSTQDAYSLYDRECEESLLPTASRLGVGFLAYTPLARGLLADGATPGRVFTADDHRSSLPRFGGAAFESYAATSAALRRWAADRGRSLPELAVAWVCRRPEVTSVLLGAKTPDQVDQVASATGWILSPAEVAEVESIARSVPNDE